MQTGIIMTMGKLAVCIQNEAGQQFYAPKQNLSSTLLTKVEETYQKYWLEPVRWAVFFDIDNSGFSFSAKGYKRFFAKNVTIRENPV
jgi:hypothetical protein